MRLQLSLVFCATLTACLQTGPRTDVVRICDSSGCSDRPSNSASYDPSAAVPDNDPERRIPALEALARKDPGAAYDLGLRFFRGDGVRQDSYRALQWMRDAAERGDLEAQKAVGRFYLTGLEEMGSDPREAEKWLTIAAGRGDKEAGKLLEEAVEARKSEDAYYRWTSHWRPVFYNYWYTGYPYRWYTGVSTARYNVSKSAITDTRKVKIDKNPPDIVITSHRARGFESSSTVNKGEVVIKGRVTDESNISEIRVNGTKTSLGRDGKFTAPVSLNIGRNLITVTAKDVYDNETISRLTIEREDESQKPSITKTTDRRIALIIGNSEYGELGQLSNPGNDAKDIAAALKQTGFSVDLLLNANQEQMEDAISEFGRKLTGGGVGLFYYAGHGIQADGENYLIPIGAKIERQKDVRYKAVDVGQVLSEMDYARNGLNIVILDACRNNPLPRSFRSGTRGLAKVEGPKGTIIGFATSPGSAASDGQERNGVYTKHLLQNIMTSKITVEQVFKRVLRGVDEETEGKQVPWMSSSFTGDFYFVSQ